MLYMLYMIYIYICIYTCIHTWIEINRTRLNLILPQNWGGLLHLQALQLSPLVFFCFLSGCKCDCTFYKWGYKMIFIYF